ncbi:rac serine-threonine kinase [Trypanosoma theileri]|uniref:Rac serine-threonine kinase n=1 Tax=Trypanosoma theileri TaxID=67003 RepID=A0A1X0P5T6_9TRYP|nr:rac serine-threonine kinase [Trypanosoma theileri]ORC91790.1 rac serine-threonine kinase [Trypanosoma theileri]
MLVRKAVSALQESVGAGDGSISSNNNNNNTNNTNSNINNKDSNDNTGNNDSSKKPSAVNDAPLSLPHPSPVAPAAPAAAAAVCVQPPDVFANSIASCTLSVDLSTTAEMQEPRRIHLLSEFERLYRIRKLLGRGSYGVVVEVVHRVTRQRKAAKFVFRKETQHSAQKNKERDCDGTTIAPTIATTTVEPNNTTRPDAAVRAIGDDTAPQRFSDGLIKEIAIALTVDHPNLVSASDVFVHDPAELQHRLQRYAPRLRCTVSHSTRPVLDERGNNNNNQKRNGSAKGIPHKTWRRSLFCGVNDSPVTLECRSRESGVGPSQQVPGVSTVVPDPRTSLDGNADSTRKTIEEVRLLLREGKIQCILVMELLGGGDLFTLISRKPLDEVKAATYMLDLLLALEHLHSRRIVHRDVKLENLVLDSNNKAHLIDYGFCEKLRRLSDSGAETDSNSHWGKEKLLSEFCGSHHYVAPEIVRAAVQLKQQMKLTESKENNSVARVKLPPISPLPRKSLEGAVDTVNTPSEENHESRGKWAGKTGKSLNPLLMSRHVGYDTSVDMWSAGVAMFVLLHSAFPFHDERRSKLLKMIMTGQQQVGPSPLLSSEAKDLLRQLLTRDVRRRLTASEALRHPWFKKAADRKKR